MTASNAPMSQLPLGRELPRWSWGGQLLVAGSPSAGLPDSSASVLVGPPLSNSGARRGSTFDLSPAACRPQELSWAMLWPGSPVIAGPVVWLLRESGRPAATQAVPPESVARIVFCTVVV